MLSVALLLFANTLLFSLRLSGGSSFPKPLSAAEEQYYLQRYAAGDSEARDVLIERNLRLVAHIIKKSYPARKLSAHFDARMQFSGLFMGVCHTNKISLSNK